MFEFSAAKVEKVVETTKYLMKKVVQITIFCCILHTITIF